MLDISMAEKATKMYCFKEGGLLPVLSTDWPLSNNWLFRYVVEVTEPRNEKRGYKEIYFGS